MKWTKEKFLNAFNTVNTKTDFIKKYYDPYLAAKKNGWMSYYRERFEIKSCGVIVNMG